MSRQKLKAPDKKVQKMTKEGVVEKNVSKQTVKRVSKRQAEPDFTDKPKESVFKGKQEQKITKRRRVQTRSPIVKKKAKTVKPADKKQSNKKQSRKKAQRKQIFEESQKKKKTKLRFDEELEVEKLNSQASSFRSAPVASARHLTSKIQNEEGDQESDTASDIIQTGEQSTCSVYQLHSKRREKRKRKQYERTHKLEHRSLRAQAESHYQQRLSKEEKLQRAGAMKRYIQKQHIKRQYIKAYKAEKDGRKAARAGVFFKAQVKRAITFIAGQKKVALTIGAIILLLVVVMNTLSSCTMGSVQVIATTMSASYLTEVEDIEAAELYYTELEAALQKKINNMEAEHPGLDEYRYNLNSIEHDPHVLISYLSAKYEVFTFEQVKSEIEALFEAQYHVKTEQVTEIREETRTVQVGESLGSVVTSGYCNCAICCGSWSGGPTASGVMPTANHTLAVDATNPTIPLGTKVVMNGVIYTVEDTGNLARNGVDFDVYYDTHAAATAHGHQTWEAYLAEGNANTVEVTTTETVEVLNVSLSVTSLQSVVRNRMDAEQKELYDLIYSTRGNLQICTSPIELNWYSYVQSYYGYRINPNTGQRELHRGVEVSVSEGTEVKSGQTGTVAEVGYTETYGYYVVTEDKKGYQLKYAHLQSAAVSAGQEINAGDVIGKTGSTGSVSGSQLYLEFVKDGVYYNPIFFVDPGEGAFGSGAQYDDETVRKLFEEAEKYLGYPYVWGGASPSTSFDCSGFISYVFTSTGVSNMGRLTAQGIYDSCTPVDPADAKPGDLIFFTGTYDGPTVTHVGLYAGDGMMLHCGDPIQYTSIYSSYWQSHFYAFGRPTN